MSEPSLQPSPESSSSPPREPASKPAAPSTGLLWAEEGTERISLVAEVAPLIPVLKTYTFAVPPALRATIQLGHRVVVGLGKSGRRAKGFVVGLSERPWDNTLRQVESLVDAESRLTPDLIELGRRIAAHYVSPIGLTLKAMVPESVRRQRGMKTVRYVRALTPREDGPDPPRTTRQDQPQSDRQDPPESEQAYPAPSNQVDPRQSDQGDPPQSDGAASEGARPVPRKLGAATLEKRERILSVLTRAGGESSVRFLLAAAGCTAAILKGMARDGLIEITERRQVQAGDELSEPRLPDFTLNDEQRAAFEAIRERLTADQFSVTLLHGVSGSGKTEVYIHAIRHVLAQGRQAILLVPEIVLTTQLVARLAARFDRVAVMHSGLTESQRSIAWRRVESGEANVVIGTRSAVFAPCARLGLICVDEEQEDSYKNLQTPRFHVRDVAIFRAHQLGIPVVLGSATPSLETWHNCQTRPEYARVALHKRVADRPMPVVHVVDMNTEQQAVGGDRVFSRLLERKLKEALERGEQAIILLNRRGYATRLWCPQCRQSVQCPRCNLSLVAHEAKGQAVCHHCYGRITLPRVCATLGCNQPLVRMGMGTQKVEAALAAEFPAARVRRVDSDTMHHRDLYVELVNDFEARRLDVLVGTQMIAKGLDFPHVSLVGVMAAESIAATADFRNQEKLFTLLTQVAGRAGRAELAGEVVIQTSLTDLPALRLARNHDYEGFAQRELALRRHLGYPPFRRLARLVVAHEREETCLQRAEEVGIALREVIARFNARGEGNAGGMLSNGEADGGFIADVLGPAPCTRPRLRDHYRYELLLRAGRASDLQQILRLLHSGSKGARGAKGLMLDVDPVAFD